MHHHEGHPHIISRNARYGLILFGVYVALYAGFIFLAVFYTPLMGASVLGGMNLAIAYGFGLLLSALVLALIYMTLCRRLIPHSRHENGGKGGA